MSVICESSGNDIKTNILTEKLIIFTKIFVLKFESKLEEFKKIAEVESKLVTDAADAIVQTSSETVVDFVAEGALSNITKIPGKVWNFYKIKKLKHKSKKITSIFRRIEKETLRSILIDAGINLFKSFEYQFISATDNNGDFHRALQKIAIDASNRAINFIYQNKNCEIITANLITRGVIRGKSEKLLNKCGYTVIINHHEYNTAKLFDQTGLVTIDQYGNPLKFYHLKHTENENYRLQLAWELEEKVLRDYTNIGAGLNYVYTLKSELDQKHFNAILEEINKEVNPAYENKFSSTLNETAENVKDIKNILMKTSVIKKSVQFCVKAPIKFFTGRSSQLSSIDDQLKSQILCEEISQVVVITGLGGIGKSELVRKYINDFGKYYDNNIIWLDAETKEQLKETLYRLAHVLSIPIEEYIPTDNDLQIETETDKNISEIKTLSTIFEAVYKYFSNTKSLFIFDNVEKMKQIIEYLPRYTVPCNHKPYVLITSRNQKWEIGDEGTIQVIKLGVFTETEAEDFIMKDLNLTENNEEIRALAHQLNYFPLVIKQASAFIKENNKKAASRGEGIYGIKQYLLDYKEDSKKLNLLDMEIDESVTRYHNSVYTACNMALRNLQHKELEGKLAIQIIEIISYISSDDIDVKEIFEDKIDEHFWNAITLLSDYSLIYFDQGIARIHRVLQDATRLQLRNVQREEQVLEKVITLFHGKNLSSFAKSHVTCVWTYAYKYHELISNNFCSELYSDDKVDAISPLHLLTIAGKFKEIKTIFEYLQHSNNLSEILDKSSSDGVTPIHCASKEGHLEIIKYFVQCGAFINVKHKGRKTPLHFAAQHGHLNVVKFLCNNGASIFDKAKSGSLPIHWAAQIGHLDIVQYFIQSGVDVNVKNNYAKTPMHYAAQSGHIEIMDFLHLKGAPYSIKSRNISLPLHYAAQDGSLEGVKYLAEKVLDLNVKNNYGKTPLHYAAQGGHVTIMQYLQANGASIYSTDSVGALPIHLAAREGQLDALKYLFHSTSDGEVKTTDGDTPMHYAAKGGHIEVIKFLHSNGINLSPRNKINIVPLHWAVAGNLDVVAYLIENGDNIEAKTDFRRAPLHEAAHIGNINIIKYLCAHGASLDTKDNNGAIPLHLAAQEGHLDVLKYFIDKGSNMYEEDEYGASSLHYAAERGHVHIIKFLYSNGACLNVKDHKGRLPLHFAAKEGFLETVKYFINEGVDVNSKCNNNTTALSNSIYYGHSHITEFLKSKS